jgi:hypothetical protein
MGATRPEPINNNQSIEREDIQLTCSECILIPKIINIDYKNYLIEDECPKHGIKSEDIKEYFKSSKEYLYKSKRNNNSRIINDEEKKNIFYYCPECKNFLCKECGDNHEHEMPLFIKINDPKNEDDIHLNNYSKYCKCNKQLYDDQAINCKNENNQEEGDSLKKLKNKKEKLEKKIENEKCINELLHRLIAMHEGQNSNHLNKDNIIKASENIIENRSEELLKKIENLENKMSYYLEKK